MNKSNTKQNSKNINSHKLQTKKRPYVASDDFFEYGEYIDLSAKEINSYMIDSFFKSYNLKSKRKNPQKKLTK